MGGAGVPSAPPAYAYAAISPLSNSYGYPTDSHTDMYTATMKRYKQTTCMYMHLLWT